MKVVSVPESFSGWRALARDLVTKHITPHGVLWESRESTDECLFQSEVPSVSPHMNKEEPAKFIPASAYRTSPEFIELAQLVSCHRSGDQWPLLYSVFWRLNHGEPHLLKITSDPEVHQLHTFSKAIRRDSHKMHAFVRFRKVGEDPETGREQFVSWFEPDHKIIPLNASFFRKRFTNMDWSILTPDECMHWDGKEIRFTPGVDQSAAPSADKLEELWLTYYRSIFNAARVKTKAMQSEMPKKYWKNLPEAAVIAELVGGSEDRVTQMLHNTPSPEKPAPRNTYLASLQELPEGSSE